MNLLGGPTSLASFGGSPMDLAPDAQVDGLSRDFKGLSVTIGDAYSKVVDASAPVTVLAIPGTADFDDIRDNVRLAAPRAVDLAMGTLDQVGPLSGVATLAAVNFAGQQLAGSIGFPPIADDADSVGKFKATLAALKREFSALRDYKPVDMNDATMWDFALPLTGGTAAADGKEGKMFGRLTVAIGQPNSSNGSSSNSPDELWDSVVSRDINGVAQNLHSFDDQQNADGQYDDLISACAAYAVLARIGRSDPEVADTSVRILTKAARLDSNAWVSSQDGEAMVNVLAGGAEIPTVSEPSGAHTFSTRYRRIQAACRAIAGFHTRYVDDIMNDRRKAQNAANVELGERLVWIATLHRLLDGYSETMRAALLTMWTTQSRNYLRSLMQQLNQEGNMRQLATDLNKLSVDDMRDASKITAMLRGISGSNTTPDMRALVCTALVNSRFSRFDQPHKDAWFKALQGLKLSLVRSYAYMTSV